MIPGVSQWAQRDPWITPWQWGPLDPIVECGSGAVNDTFQNVVGEHELKMLGNMKICRTTLKGVDAARLFANGIPEKDGDSPPAKLLTINRLQNW